MSCRKALMKVEAKGGLSNEEKAQVEKELKDMGLTGIEVNAPEVGDVKYGQEAIVIVKAKYSHRMLVSLFTFTNNEQEFEYNRSVVCRKVQNV